MIVNLAIEDEDQRAVRTHHRLVPSSRPIDNRESPRPNAGAITAPHPGIIRTTMPHQVARDYQPIAELGGPLTHHANDAAHLAGPHRTWRPPPFVSSAREHGELFVGNPIPVVARRALHGSGGHVHK